MPGLNPLVDKIRTMHPGAYDDMDDAALTKAVLSKYPQYSDLAAPSVPKPPNPIQQVIQNNFSPAAGVAGMAGGSPNLAPATDTMGKVAGGAIGAGALAAIGPSGLATIGRNALPFVAAEGINLARTKLGAAGKFIPPGAEILPFLVGGGKGKAAAAEGEAAAETKAASAAEVPTPAKAPVPAPPAPKPARPPVPSGAEPDIEMEMRGAVDNPPTTQIKGVPDKLGTPAQEARMREAMVSRDTAKKALESGGAKAAEKQLVGPDPYASKSAPKMESVQSTNVNKIGHDGKHLWVEYKSGQVYRYKDVPTEVFNQAKEADSVGSFLSKNVKGRYDTSLKGTARK